MRACNRLMKSSCQTTRPSVQRCFGSHQTAHVNLSDPQTHRYDDESRCSHRLAYFLRILKPDLANTLTVQGRRTRRCFRVPNSHSLVARVPVLTPNHDEGVGRGLNHHRTVNPNLLLNLKDAVARKGYKQCHIGAPTVRQTSKQNRDVRPRGASNGEVSSVRCTVPEQPTRLIDWHKPFRLSHPQTRSGCQRVAPRTSYAISS